MSTCSNSCNLKFLKGAAIADTVCGIFCCKSSVNNATMSGVIAVSSLYIPDKFLSLISISEVSNACKGRVKISCSNALYLSSSIAEPKLDINAGDVSNVVSSMLKTKDLSIFKNCQKYKAELS